MKRLTAHLADEGLALLPAGLALVVLVAWTASGGGYETLPTLSSSYTPDPWYLGSLALIGVFAVAVANVPRVRLSRPATLALAAFGLYACFSYLSILWAHDRGTAFAGSARVLVYVVIFALFAILPWRRRGAHLVLWALTAATGVLVAVTAVRIATASHPAGLYINARLASPLGYENADSALFMLTALTATALAALPRAPALARVAGPVIAAGCLQLALMTQSRGWLFTVPVIVILALVVLPDRFRFALFALGPIVATAAIAAPLLRVYASASKSGSPIVEPGLSRALHVHGRHAAALMLIADAILVLVALAAVAIERRLVRRGVLPLREPRAGWRRFRLGTVALLVVAGIGGGLVATHGHPIRRLEHAANSFANSSNEQTGASRFSSLGSQRYDFWRVAVDELGRHPLSGLGQDNFAEAYLLNRKTGAEPRWIHSLELRVLAHTGIVGGLLFLAFLAGALIAALRAPRRERERRALVAIALLPLIVWIVHGSVDWFWELPALSGPALALLGIAVALGRGEAGAPEAAAPEARAAETGAAPAAGGRAHLIARSGALVLSLGALAALALPYVAARDVASALGEWRGNPTAAYRALDRAASLEPFNAQPDLVAGAIALQLGQLETARSRFAAAARRDSHGWLAPFALGLIAASARQPQEAARQLARAHALDPRESLVALALRRAGTSHPLTLAEVESMLTERSVVRFGG